MKMLMYPIIANENLLANLYDTIPVGAGRWLV
jgi:hypothetical protein